MTVTRCRVPHPPLHRRRAASSPWRGARARAWRRWCSSWAPPPAWPSSPTSTCPARRPCRTWRGAPGERMASHQAQHANGQRACRSGPTLAGRRSAGHPAMTRLPWSRWPSRWLFSAQAGDQLRGSVPPVGRARLPGVRRGGHVVRGHVRRARSGNAWISSRNCQPRAVSPLGLCFLRSRPAALLRMGPPWCALRPACRPGQPSAAQLAATRKPKGNKAAAAPSSTC